MRLTTITYNQPYAEFQFTHLHEVRLTQNGMTSSGDYFNSRTYTRCDHLHGAQGTQVQISIHAPTRGATYGVLRAICLLTISIHAPTRGATLNCAGTPFVSAISIHAPTRGATWKSSSARQNSPFQFTHLHEVRRYIGGSSAAGVRNFNSRTYTRCDAFGCCTHYTIRNFNSRTYTRCDEKVGDNLEQTTDFNSRTYTRCDVFADKLKDMFIISIHAPTRGATAVVGRR